MSAGGAYQRKYGIWGASLGDLQLISKYQKGFQFLCVVDIFNKYALVVTLKVKKVVTITNALLKFLDESNRKPNKM